MKKWIIGAVLFSIIYVATAQAERLVEPGQHLPAAGDAVVYEGFGKYGEVFISEINRGYDPVVDAWWIWRENYGVVREKKPWSSAMTKEVMDNCISRQGSIEQVRVPAGIFQSCKLRDGDTYIWYADVPIRGWAKQESLDGKTMRIELQSYRWGDSDY